MMCFHNDCMVLFYSEMLLRSFQEDDLLGSFLISLLLFIYCYFKIITFYEGNNNVQYDDTNNWNAMTGSRYSDQQNTRSSSTRVNSTGGRATYGTSSLSMSQLSLNNNGRTRSNRRKANRDIASLPQESPRNNKQSRRNKTPETIDITNSDSEDDIVVDDNQIMEVRSCLFFYHCFNQFFHFVNSSFSQTS
jgi:hypothetical protein